MKTYTLRVKKDCFFQSSKNIIAIDIIIENDYVTFKTNEMSKMFFDEHKIDYEIITDSFIKIKKGIRYTRPFIFGILLFISIIYINQYRVCDISFSKDTPINTTIKEDIEKNYKNLLFWDFCSIDLNTYSSNLRAKYPNFPWISCYKVGSTINVDISEYDETKIEENELISGNIVATKDAIIETYEVYSGICNIKRNQYVKAGDILVSSSLDNKTYYMSRGIILGYTFTEYSLNVLKNEKETIKSGRVNDYKSLCILNNNFNFNKTYDFLDYEDKKENIFNLFDVISFKRIVENEKCDIIKTYTSDEASIYAKTKIENYFNSKIVDGREKIVDIHVLNVIESDTSYNVHVLTKALESIGKFQAI